jgi:hypothetical protein
MPITLGDFIDEAAPREAVIGEGVARACASLRSVGDDDAVLSTPTRIARRLLSLPQLPSLDPSSDQLPPAYVFEAGDWHYRGSEHLEAWVARELYRCATNPLYFVTTYCAAENLHDEQAMESVPSSLDLIPNWPQVWVLVQALCPPHDAIIVKSRRMMATWIMMAIALHDLLFERIWPMMALSRVEDNVDDGGENSTSYSLFGKVRFLHDHLPDFLQQPLEFKHLRVVNRSRGTSLLGFGSSRSPGRGGGYRRAFLDEFAWVENSELVMASVNQACARGKILTSTPHGKANAFYRIHQEAYAAFPQGDQPRYPGQYARYRIHWSLHPHRNEAWKEQEVRRLSMTTEAVAQELETNFEGSIGGRVYSPFTHERHMTGGAECPIGTPVAYDPRRPLVLCCDFNFDPLVWEIAQVWPVQPIFRVIDEICRRGAMVDDGILEFTARYGSRKVVDDLFAQDANYQDQYGRQGTCIAGELGHTGPLYIYGDATEEKSTVHNRIKTYQGMKHAFAGYGFAVTLKVPPKNPPVAHRLEIVNHALKYNFLVLNPAAEELRKDFEYGVWNGNRTDVNQTTEDDDGSGLTRSHGSSALGYWLAIVHKARTSVTAVSRANAPPSPTTYLPEYARRW